MERQISKRKKQIRRRKRLLRKLIIFVYRCICLGLMAGVVFLGIHIYKWMFVEHPNVLSPEEYPESLIALYESNPEAKDFVLDYPENKEKEFHIDLSDEVEQGSIPLFLQWDKRWGYEIYGTDFVAVTGCGPTCLSMVRCGLSGDTVWNPLVVAELAQDLGFYVEGSGSSWELMTTGAAEIDLEAKEVIFDAEHILASLKSGNPIICAMRAGDFTTSGHFVVLAGVNEKGEVTVCDPNSRKNSEKPWAVEELMPQIKNLWSYTYIG